MQQIALVFTAEDLKQPFCNNRNCPIATVASRTLGFPVYMGTDVMYRDSDVLENDSSYTLEKRGVKPIASNLMNLSIRVLHASDDKYPDNTDTSGFTCRVIFDL